jgi:hypothetical protein
MYVEKKFKKTWQAMVHDFTPVYVVGNCEKGAKDSLVLPLVIDIS